MSRTTRRRAVRAVAPVAGLLAAGLLVWQGSYAAFAPPPTTRRRLEHRDAGTHEQRWHRDLRRLHLRAVRRHRGRSAGEQHQDRRDRRQVHHGAEHRDAGRHVKLYAGAITGTNGAAIAPQILLTIDAAGVAAATNVAANCTGFPATGTTPIANGSALSAMPSTYAGAPGMAVGTATQRVAYRISGPSRPPTRPPATTLCRTPPPRPTSTGRSSSSTRALMPEARDVIAVLA